MVNLKGPAINALEGDESKEILEKYTATEGFQQMQSFTLEAAPELTNATTSPAVPGMGAGGSSSGVASTSVGVMSEEHLVKEYEVFNNAKDAIAFFLFHQESLDKNSKNGPFYFTIEGENSIVAGTKEFYATSTGVKPEVIAKAKARGVIILMEFEGDTPVRCTPCYFTDKFF